MIRDIWIILFAFGGIFFSWPLLSIFGHGLAFYLFAAWFLFILLMFVAAELWKKGDDGG